MGYLTHCIFERYKSDWSCLWSNALGGYLL